MMEGIDHEQLGQQIKSEHYAHTQESAYYRETLNRFFYLPSISLRTLNTYNEAAESYNLLNLYTSQRLQVKSNCELAREFLYNKLFSEEASAVLAAKADFTTDLGSDQVKRKEYAAAVVNF